MTLPPPLDPHSALFLDLDGTLLEIASRPEMVIVPEGLAGLLTRLAEQRGGALALVSGRRIAELDRLLQPWRGAAAGIHGAERRGADGSVATSGNVPADRKASAALDRLRPALSDLAARVPGVLLEDKGRTLAVHYRQAPDKAEMIRSALDKLLREHGDTLRLIAGKMVFELQPCHHGKHGAIAAFMAETPFRGRVPVFVGDDTTDEDGFAEVNRRGGLSVRVGPEGDMTQAVCGLSSVSAVLDWLRGGGDGTPSARPRSTVGRNQVSGSDDG
jgi:trehalose 6-phosphate phosphatase